MKRTIIRRAAMFAAAAMAAGNGWTQEPAPTNKAGAPEIRIGAPMAVKTAALDPSLAHETEAAIARSFDWLAANQRPDGSWSDTNFPALTALPLWAFANGSHPRKNEVCEKAVRFILSCVQPDGGIYRKLEGRVGGGLSNYNTSSCMAALHATRRPDVMAAVLNARKFIAASQYMGDDAYRGGLGYDASTKRNYTDLMNSLFGFEAMRLTESAEVLRDKKDAKADLDWGAAQKFLERLQNDANSDKANAGGFPYRPDESKAGAVTNQAGKVIFQSYGSMTYAGLLAMVYCKVDRNDPRVRSAFDWSANHWSLEENPGMGPQGQYFFYHVLSKALAAYGQDKIPLKEGAAISWRADVVKKLLTLQKITPEGQGYWVNSAGRFMEADPVLCTAYCLLALQMASGL